MRITAFLKDAAPTGRAVPGPLPDNMPSRFYAWRELVNLYTTADIVVVPLCATACSVGKPIIATETQALRDAFATPNSVCWVRPEGPETLCAAVETLIAALKGRADMAASAARAQKEHHGFQPALETMTAALEALWARKERDRIWHQNSAPAGCGVSSWK